MLLLRTVHGSRLYGLHNADSDYDWFEVYGWGKAKTRHKITGDDDRTRTSYDTFMRYCDKGVPQFLEALFSRKAEVDHIAFIRENYVVNLPHVRDVYLRTMKNFWLGGNFKLRRHALRLLLNLREMQDTGQFNPTLNIQEIFWINQLAQDGSMPDPFDY